jgi:hypothetical protein
MSITGDQTIRAPGNFAPQGIEQAAEVPLEARDGVEVLGIVRSDGDHDVGPVVMGEVGHDDVAQLRGGGGVEARRTPGDRTSGVARQHAGQKRRDARVGAGDAHRRCRGIAQDEEADRHALAGDRMRHRSLGRQQALRAQPDADALPGVDRKGEPGQERKQRGHGVRRLRVADVLTYSRSPGRGKVLAKTLPASAAYGSTVPMFDNFQLSSDICRR